MKIFRIKILWILIFILFNAAQNFSQNNSFNITSFGAVGDGKTLCTKALQTAIASCNAKGGGDVLIPPGIFMIGTVHLKTNIHLQLNAGAVLRGSTNLNDYENFIPDTPYKPVCSAIASVLQ